MKVIGNTVYFYSPSDIYSNHNLCDMVINGITFNCVEQYMMYKKAMLFGDVEIAEVILREMVPQKQKQLGRDVKNFNQDVWNQEKVGIVYEGCFNKFATTYLRDEIEPFLGYEFVEASPTDIIWGIGLSIDDDRIFDREKWQGENLLGKIITQVGIELKRQKRKIKD